MYPIEMNDNIGPKLVKSMLDWYTCKYIGINNQHPQWYQNHDTS